MGLGRSMRILSCLSAISSSAVVITCLSFKTMRKSYFTRLIMLIAACDVMVSFAGIIGFPSEHNPWCEVQGCLETFFLRANWFWTTALVYQLYSFAFHRIFVAEWKLHVVVWTLSSLLSFLPLIYASYGRGVTYGSSEMCFLSSASDAWISMWMIIDWFGCVFACAATMLFLITRVYIHYTRMRHPPSGIGTPNPVYAEGVISLIKSLYVYPLVMIATWGVNTALNVAVLFIAGSNPSSKDNYAVGATIIWAVTNGIWLSAVFFFKSAEARYQWKRLALRCVGHLLRRNRGDNNNNIDEGDGSTMMIDPEHAMTMDFDERTDIIKPMNNLIVLSPNTVLTDISTTTNSISGRVSHNLKVKHAMTFSRHEQMNDDFSLSISGSQV